jgi:hypothetical protein
VIAQAPFSWWYHAAYAVTGSANVTSTRATCARRDRAVVATSSRKSAASTTVGSPRTRTSVASPRRAPPSTVVHQRGAGHQASATTAATTRNPNSTSLRTACSRSSCIASNNIGTVASVATHVFTPRRRSRTYAATAVSRPSRSWTDVTRTSDRDIPESPRRKML